MRLWAPQALSGSRVAVALVLVSCGQPDGSAAVSWLWIVALTLIAASDVLDGFVARRLAVASPLGSVVDTAADRIVEALLLSSLCLFGRIPEWLLWGYVLRVCLVDAARLHALKVSGRVPGWSEWRGWPAGVLFSKVGRGGYATAKLFLFGGAAIFGMKVWPIAAVVLVVAVLRGVAVGVGLESWLNAQGGAGHERDVTPASTIYARTGIAVDALAIVLWSASALAMRLR